MSLCSDQQLSSEQRSIFSDLAIKFWILRKSIKLIESFSFVIYLLDLCIQKKSNWFTCLIQDAPTSCPHPCNIWTQNFLHWIQAAWSRDILIGMFDLVLWHWSRSWSILRRGFLKNRHACFELSHSIESSLRSLSTL